MPDYKYSRGDYMRLSNAPCIEVALALGMEIDEKKSNAKAWKIKGEQGLCIFTEGNNWYRFSDGKGGFPVDLVKDKLCCDTEQALDFIAQNVVGRTSELKKRKNISAGKKETPHNDSKDNFIVPPHSVQPKRAMAYLIKTRGIDPDIVKAMIQRKMIAEDDIHHNCLFFGRDKDGVVRSCSLRGTTSTRFRGEVPNGDKQYTFEMQGNNDVLRLFESPIDAMSHATFSKLLGRDWTADHRLSTNGSGIYECIKRYIAEHPEIKTVWFSFDNDEGGKKGADNSIEKLKQDFADRNLNIKTCFPLFNKDWNEDLQAFRETEKNGMTAAEFLKLKPPSEQASTVEEDCDMDEMEM